MQLTEQALTTMMQGGWSNLPDHDTRDFISGERDIDNLKAQYENALDTFEMAKKIHDVFTTGNGPEVLAFYRRLTLDIVQFNPLAENPNESGFFHSGEANIVLNIVRAIAAAEKGPPQIPPELVETQGEE